MNPKVAIIAPYAELRRMADEIAIDLGANVQVLEGDLQEGVVAARQAVKDGAEVIRLISARRATAYERKRYEDEA